MRLEPKPATTSAGLFLYPAGAIGATLVFASLLVLVAGASPFNVFWLVLKGAAGSQFAIVETLTRATPLILTGLAVAVAVSLVAGLYAGLILWAALGATERLVG